MALFTKRCEKAMLISILCLTSLAIFARGTEISNALMTLTFERDGCTLNGEKIPYKSVLTNNRCVRITCIQGQNIAEIRGCPPSDEDFLQYEEGDNSRWPNCCRGYEVAEK
uniref:Putative secreted protein n=1 Tax=Amblyomma americanum TaxID=6943 RepID=A0A0C9S3R6_AMBAM